MSASHVAEVGAAVLERPPARCSACRRTRPAPGSRRGRAWSTGARRARRHPRPRRVGSKSTLYQSSRPPWYSSATSTCSPSPSGPRTRSGTRAAAGSQASSAAGGCRNSRRNQATKRVGRARRVAACRVVEHRRCRRRRGSRRRPRRCSYSAPPSIARPATAARPLPRLGMGDDRRRPAAVVGSGSANAIAVDERLPVVARSAAISFSQLPAHREPQVERRRARRVERHGRRSTVASSGSVVVERLGARRRRAGSAVRRRGSTLQLGAATGEPGVVAAELAELPLARSASTAASRTSARSARSKSAVRGRPSSRFQTVTVGNAPLAQRHARCPRSRNGSAIVVPPANCPRALFSGEVDRDRDRRAASPR